MNRQHSDLLFISWQEIIASSKETGRDYDQCLILNRKSEEFEKEMQVEAKQLERLNTLAKKLITNGHAGAESIRQRRDQLNEKWERFKDRGAERKRELGKALDVYAFQKSCDELSDNINEKVCTTRLRQPDLLSICSYRCIDNI